MHSRISSSGNESWISSRLGSWSGTSLAALKTHTGHNLSLGDLGSGDPHVGHFVGFILLHEVFFGKGYRGICFYIIYHSICSLSRTNVPVSDWGAWVASQVMESAPSWTERSAFWPPMSVRTQPGETAFTEMFLCFSAAAS